MVYISKIGRKKRRIKKIKKFFSFFLFPLFLFFILFLFFWNSNFLRIEKIIIIGENISDSEKIKKDIEKKLEENYYYFFSKRNIFFYPEERISEIILKKYEDIKNLSVEYKFFEKIFYINIEKKIPSFLYCLTIRQEECFFMERNGKIFSKFNERKNEKGKEDFIIFFEKEKEGGAFSPIKNFEKIVFLIEEIEKNYFDIEKVKRNGYGDFIIFLKNKTKIIFSNLHENSKILETFKKILETENLKVDKKNKKFKKKITYINLSHGKNIFYCFVGDECENNY